MAGRPADRLAGRPAETAFLTTQPGWAFATLAELRAGGAREFVELAHRDSTLVVPAEALPDEVLLTPADVYGTVQSAGARGEWDATRVLAGRVRRMEAREMREVVGRWSAAGSRRAAHRWSVGGEVWGDTQVQRRQLREVAAGAMRVAFPRWREEVSGGVRLLVKADTRAALLGVQQYSNLAETEEGRPGTLREHLACGLLTLAGCRRLGGRAPGEAVLDPFMGSGTILEAAARRYGAELCLGTEIDRAALRLARERLRGVGAETRLCHASFDDLDPADVPEGTRLVSNLPFGTRFEQVPTVRLARFLADLAPRLAGMALLMGRDQAVEVAGALRPSGIGVRVKNVIVLGQPAAIAFWPQLRI